MEKFAASAQNERCVQRRPLHPKRSSIADMSILRRLAIIGVICGATNEMAQTKIPYEAPPAVTQNLRTMDDILYTVRAELGDISIEEQVMSPNDVALPPDPGIAPFAMTKAGIAKLWSMCEKLWSEPGEAAIDISHDVEASARYLQDYRLSKDEASQIDPERLDCNDHANVTCERLQQQGMPMYLLSIWPEDPSKRFDKGWHQMAVCKVREDCYFIFDDQKMTLWHGSLAAFARQYGSDICTRIIPYVGISTYVEPKYDNFVSKFLVQGLHGTEDERNMRSLNLPLHRRPVQLVSR
ncbi:hypothetical protein AUJ46_01780 [Candidatus Peregrinibacteria bacterium CG1_02_54_53]|nr:MAG: hypothetical protein AUJ46_01780 [Candidatus Peregrinibacteria bacterium CG1_02_54_53]